MEIKHIHQYFRPSVVKSSDVDGCDMYVLQNGNGIKLQVISYGATVTSLQIPVKDKMVDVVLGFDTVEKYVDSFSLPSAPYLGATIGRYAGRIANGQLSLNGEKIQLDSNDGRHSLHGGSIGMSRMNWNVKSVHDYHNPSITLQCISHDGDDNYPGEMIVDLTYTLSETNEFIVEYTATANKDTVVNLTHHSYFNLDGHDSDVRNQFVRVNSKSFLETDSENIPTGRILETHGTRFDYWSPKNCPSDIDTTFVLGDNGHAVTLAGSKNNLKLSVFTDQPAVHMYVGGNCFNIIKGKDGAHYHATSGICFETQNFPDAPNHPHFPNSVLKKGETYRHKTIYKFDCL